jgi:hypothetical protein
MGTYTSKYTGQEIDENLDKLKDITNVASTDYVDELVGNIENLLKEV